MDILKILKAHNLEGDSAELIETAIKNEIHKSFIPKAQYNKKVNELDAVKTENDDFRARAEQPNEFEGKYNDTVAKLESLQGEFDRYKSDITLKETRNTIRGKIEKGLKENGFTNDKVVDLLLKDLNYDEISLDGDELKGFDLNSFSDNYKEFKTKSTTEGAPLFNPPKDEMPSNVDPWLNGYII